MRRTQTPTNSAELIEPFFGKLKMMPPDADQHANQLARLLRALRVFVVEPLQCILEMGRFKEAANGGDVLYWTPGVDLNRGEEPQTAQMTAQGLWPDRLRTESSLR